MNSKKAILAVLLMIVIVVSSSCSAPAATPAAPSAPEQPTQAPSTNTESAPAEPPATVAAAPTSAPASATGGTVIIAMAQEPDKISNAWSSFAVSKMAASLISDPLFTYDGSSELIPRLAAELPSQENGGISADGKTYTLKLRDDVKWQDGEPFTAQDVVFTLGLVGNKETGVISPKNFGTVTAKDDTTVEVVFPATNATFLNDLTDIVILPQHTLKDVTDFKTADYWQNPYPGTGAFKFSKWERGSNIQMEKNPDYYLGAPKLDKIVFQFISNSDAMMTAIQNGEVDMTFSIVSSDVALYKAMENVQVVETPAFSAFSVIFNLRNPLLKDVRTRQALNYAVDREGILNNVVGGLGSLKYSPMPKPSWAWVDVDAKYGYDVEKAKSLLEEAGWKDANNDGVREAQGVKGITDGTPFAWTINNIQGENERLQICQILQEQWGAVGAKVDINTTDVANYVATNNKGEFAMSYGFLSVTPDPSSMAYWYKTENALNWHGIAEAFPDMQKLLMDAEQTLDRTQRKELYAQFQQTIAAGATDLFIYDRNFYHVVNNRVQGFKPNSTGAVVWNASEWSVSQ